MKQAAGLIFVYLQLVHQVSISGFHNGFRMLSLI